MNSNVGIGLLIVGCIGLVGIGALIDATGGVTVRTNIAPDSVALTVFNPLSPGALSNPTWSVVKNSLNKEVELVLITQTKEHSLVHGSFISGTARVVIPCDVVSGKARLELIGQQNRNVLSSVPVEILPPGPDCVR